jgi:hypothetical protein
MLTAVATAPVGVEVFTVRLAGVVAALARGGYLPFRRLRSIVWQFTLLRLGRHRSNTPRHRRAPERPGRAVGRSGGSAQTLEEEVQLGRETYSVDACRTLREYGQRYDGPRPVARLPPGSTESRIHVYLPHDASASMAAESPCHSLHLRGGEPKTGAGEGYVSHERLRCVGRARSFQYPPHAPAPPSAARLPARVMADQFQATTAQVLDTSGTSSTTTAVLEAECPRQRSPVLARHRS